MNENEEFVGTKRELMVLQRQRRGDMSRLPRWHSLSLDTKVFVDRDGLVSVVGPSGRATVCVAQCIPK